MPKGWPIWKPMGANTYKLSAGPVYPTLVSRKIDGIRATSQVSETGAVKAYSKSGKHLPSRYIQNEFSLLPEGLDGELVAGEPNKPDTINKTQTVVMSHYHATEPLAYDKVTYYVFDYVTKDTIGLNYMERLTKLEELLASLPTDKLTMQVEMVETFKVSNFLHLEKLHTQFIAEGFEGTIMRHQHGHYVLGGRAWLSDFLKWKPWYDDEAVVMEVIEGTGRNKNTVGALRCKWSVGGKETVFTVSGLSDKERSWWWFHRRVAAGSLVKIKHCGTTPSGMPRFPSYICHRHKIDT